MIPVTKDEARILRELFPDGHVTRTMRQDSKRHRYYATEDERMMRAIANTNDTASAIVKRIDDARELRRKRMNVQGGR